MCEALDASAKPEEQQLQGRQGSLEELNFEAQNWQWGAIS